MLTDPFVLKAPSLAAHTALSVVETISLARTQEQGGASVYVGKNSDDMPVSLRIAHSESRENTGGTQRVLVRVDVNGFINATQPGSMFAYAVIGYPKEAGSELWNDPEHDAGTSASELVQYLIAALATANSDGKTDETRIPRLIAGES
jgi:hypothetical protein